MLFRGRRLPDPVRDLRRAIIVVTAKANRNGTAIDVRIEALRLMQTYPASGLSFVEIENLIVRIAELNQCKVKIGVDDWPAV